MSEFEAFFRPKGEDREGGLGQNSRQVIYAGRISSLNERGICFKNYEEVAKHKLLYVWLDSKSGALFLFEPLLGERQKSRAGVASFLRQQKDL